MPDTSEHERIREQFRDRPGVAHHVIRASNELDNADAYGNTTRAEAARAELKSFGYVPEQDRKAAAQARREEAKADKAKRESGDGDGEDKPAAPQGRTGTPRQTTSSAKPASRA